ncbi:MAG: HlyC/CorC family transporter [Pirellulales bacterium]|nr:HlyC/CorC family transporter [Pirellulales bacterium]
MSLLILSVAGALAISALCSLMEASLLSLRPGQIAEMSAQRPRIGAIWRRLAADIDQPIAAILILNTAAHTIGASVAGAEFDRLYGDRWIWVFSLVFTWMMLQFTEILPKTAGVRHNAFVAFWMARPLDLLIRAMRPVQAVVQFINRPFGEVPPKTAAPTTCDEITGLTDFARLSGQISTEQERIIKKGMRLAASRVRDVMRPRVDIDAINADMPPEEVVGAIAMSGFSRVPVYEGDLDHIFGFVYIKDLLLDVHMCRPVELRRLLRPLLMVPETLEIDRLLEMFRKEQTQMAVVLDEYGGTEGLVTLEDVLEELVGAIHDEHRREDAKVVRRDETSWLASGSTGVADLLEVIGRPELRSAIPSNVSTVGGLLQAQIDRVAVVGDRTVWNGLSLEVTDVVGQRIERLLVSVVAPDETRR